MRVSTARLSRYYRAVCAAVTAFALVLQYVLMLDASDYGPAKTTLNFFSYFTILTNILVALAFAAPLFPGDGGFAGLLKSAPARAAVTLYIAIVGLVYFALLRHAWDPQGWQLLADRLLHYATPALFIIDWLAFSPKSGIPRDAPLRWLAYPLAFGVCVLLRGSVDGFYPYPFLDVGALGYARVGVNLCGLLAAFLAGGALIRLLSRALASRDRALVHG